MHRPFSSRILIRWRSECRRLCEADGAAILEFAISLPLLLVFVVGIYDFGGAFDQKQKIEQAAQEGAIVAGAQPTSDLFSDGTVNGNPPSLLPVVSATLTSLIGSGIIASGACTPPGTVSASGLTWTYTISGCSASHASDNLVIAINRGWVCSSGASCGSAPPEAVGTTVTVTYPYHWRFSSVIGLLIPGASYATQTSVAEAATVHNQM
jgi:hypothetical protein